jgi:NTP pyrophosphatase (non-canonical NTP hydrolase)
MLDLLTRVIQFREEPDRARYYNTKDLAISLSLEVAELLELLQWKSPEKAEQVKSDPEVRKRVGEEIADIFHLLPDPGARTRRISKRDSTRQGQNR